MYRTDIEDMEQKLNSLEDRLDLAVRVFAEQGGQKLVSHAKQHAPWTDRTGAARGRLNSRVEQIDTGYRIVLAYGVDYGIWLELAHEKKYSIIPQTLNYVGSNQIVPSFNHFIEQLRI